MDTGFGFLAVKTIAAAGASGLTTLIVLVSYGACTGVIIIKHVIKRRLKESYLNWKGRYA
jgi:predicted permease